ncbi:MAG TPA: SEL1-like repeat protein, partial [Candidatus Scybalocola faecigallinarum]|nr:SEL1-like repeat protein [Candidatus Scybalocola faecigallinarum]
LMVGGTSRVPLVQTMVKQMAAGVPVYCSADVDLAVARGALMFAKSGERLENGSKSEKAGGAGKAGAKDAGAKTDVGSKAGPSVGDRKERKNVSSVGTASHSEQAAVLGDVPPQVSGYTCLFIAYGSHWEIYPLEASSEQAMNKLKAAAGKMPSNLKILKQQGDSLIVGIKADKTVAAQLTGNPLLLGIPQGTEKEISQWKDITDLEMGFHFAAGIKSDQRVIVTENSGLQTEVSQWRQICAVSCGFYHIAGLRNDRTVVAAGRNSYGQCNVGEWKDIVAIACGSSHTVGLKADGTVVGAGKNDDGQLYVSSWRNITQVACGTRWTIGLKSDGTVVAAGFNEQGQCQVSGWKEIRYVFCISGRTVGIKKDGSVLCTDFRKLSGGRIQALPEKVFRLPEKLLAGEKTVSDKSDRTFNIWAKQNPPLTRKSDAEINNKGSRYFYGIGMDRRDFAEALKWFYAGAQKGYSAAQFNYGYCCFYGYGRDEDRKEAVQWYLKAARQGDYYGMIHLGDCYFYGEGIGKDYSEAVYWYEKAAQKRHPYALDGLGRCYEGGYGVRKDPFKADQYFLEAVNIYRGWAEKGIGPAFGRLGEYYRDNRGVPRNPKLASQYFEKARNITTWMPLYKNLKEMLEKGSPVYCSLDMSLACDFSEGEEKISGTLGYILGKAYSTRGEKYYMESAICFRIGAEKGRGDAQLRLGECYEFGWGVEQDYAKAIQWYQKAADQGISQARERLIYVKKYFL